MSDDEIIEAAENFCREIDEDGRVELDPEREINRITSARGSGAWVRAWVFVPED